MANVICLVVAMLLLLLVKVFSIEYVPSYFNFSTFYVEYTEWIKNILY